METKLTLKLDKAIINSAKKYAERNNKSLSKLVETYFRNLVSQSDQGKVKYSPLVEELSGVISEKDLDGLDYVEYLEGKYE
ncbi:hypothetical protein SDC9_72552 [bioreactor metagenome]|jgi:hypothetical protein|uniref:Antitoxin n=2 Tax=root TaxID=1 RepID=A0A644YDU6_9ZZZZ|nr:DUF6364 family protein [Spirochaetia bacterium]VBB39980.1 putative toxin-antitoxin system, antitoxin component, ribbon-helix-helix domain protein [uncultured Spirochaetota bacterium]